MIARRLKGRPLGRARLIDRLGQTLVIDVAVQRLGVELAVPGVTGEADGVAEYAIDIVMRGDRETPFFDDWD